MFAVSDNPLIRMCVCALGVATMAEGQVGTRVESLCDGKHTRVVWLEGGEKLKGGGRLMGFDSRDDAAAEILPAATNQNRPILCTGGNRVVVSRNYSVHVVNWDGTGSRFVADGIASDVWIEPTTGHEWVFVRSGGGTTDGPLYRYRLDDPSDSMLVCDQGLIGTYYIDWWQVSADGKVACDFLPWNRCFIIENGGLEANGTRTGIGRGCWSSLSPDNSYHSVHFPADGDGHREFAVYRHLEHVANVALDPVPRYEGTTNECFHPRFASKGGRFFSLSSGYMGRDRHDSVEIYIGKFNSGYSGIDGWVRITENVEPDFVPDAWVGVEPPSPSITFSEGTVGLTVEEGSADDAVDTVRVSTPYGTFHGPTAVSDSPWLSVVIAGSGAQYQVISTVDVSVLSSGRYTGTVTVTDSAALPVSRSYSVVVTVTGTPVVSSIELDPSAARVATGDSLQFRADVLDQTGQPLDPQPLLAWSVTGAGNTVDDNGVFTAGSTTGACTLVVSHGSVADTALLFVTSPEAAAITMSYPQGGEEIDIGQEITIRFRVHDPLVLWIHGKASVDGGRTWHVVTDSVNKWSGTLFTRRKWTVPAELDTGGGTVALAGDSILIGIFDVWDHGVGAVTPTPCTIAPALEMTAPAGDTVVWVGDTLMIGWRAASYLSGVNIEVSADAGDTWHKITSTAIRRGEDGWPEYPWVVQETVDGASMVSENVLVRVTNYADEAQYVTNDTPITIRSEAIRVLAPSGGDRFSAGDSLRIRWTVDTSKVSSCRVRLSLDSGASWYEISQSAIAPAADGSGTFTFVVPGSLQRDGHSRSTVSSRCMVEVYDDGGGLTGRSSGLFAIEPDVVLLSCPGTGPYMVTDTIRIRYRADSSVQAVVLVSVDSGATWQTLSSGSTSGVDDSGWTTFSWVAEENVNDGETGVVALRVRVCDTSGVPCIPCGHDLLVQADTAVPISVMCLDSGPYLTNDTLVLRYQADTVLVHASVWVSLDSGGTWKQPDGWASLPDDSGWVSYSWVPARDSIPGQTVGAVDYRVRVCDSSGAPCVSCGSPVPLHRYPLALTAPGSTDTFMVGDTLTVRWGLDTALIDTCVLAFSVDSGATWYTIARLGGEPAAAGTFLWHVPETIDGSDLMSTSACVVRVMSADSAFAAYSEGTFTIERPEGEPDDEPGDDSGCGCGTGTGLALIPPVGIRLASAYRRRRRRKKARGSR